MSDGLSEYETVVGLEVHAQLKTNTKLFCGDSISYGAEPNTQVSPITLAHPGTLPKLNKKAVEYAVKMGLACQCRIETNNFFARKNYFYPDLPKGYQISQHTYPICAGGLVKIETNDGEKIIRLNRIHLEEDAGKSLHDIDENFTSIDYNRAGTPLIEIVTEPDLRSGEEAFAYLTEIRKLVRYLGVCDGNMEEGSLRCDANISVRKKGDTRLGTKVEIKNLNSIRFVKKAIEHESKRMIQMLERGEKIIQETRSFDPGTGSSFAIREKEDADDYRYFAEPDLALFILTDDYIISIKNAMPMLPEQKMQQFVLTLGLSKYDAQLLATEKDFGDYFEELVQKDVTAKAAANWMLGPVKTWLNENQKEISEFPVKPAKLAGVINLVANNKLSFTAASSKLFNELLRIPDKDPEELAIGLNLIQESDSAELEKVIDSVIARYPDKVNEYKKGKKGLLSLFVGEVMKQTKGKADPKKTNLLLLEKLKF